MTWPQDNEGFQAWVSTVDPWWDDETQALVYAQHAWGGVHLGYDGSVHIDADSNGSADWFETILQTGDHLS